MFSFCFVLCVRSFVLFVWFVLFCFFVCCPFCFLFLSCSCVSVSAAFVVSFSPFFPFSSRLTPLLGTRPAKGTGGKHKKHAISNLAMLVQVNCLLCAAWFSTAVAYLRWCFVLFACCCGEVLFAGGPGVGTSTNTHAHRPAVFSLHSWLSSSSPSPAPSPDIVCICSRFGS